MQEFIATGRLCNNPRLTEGSSGVKKVTFSLAVGREYKKENFPEADFFFCIAFGDKATFIYNKLKKGMKVEVKGEIQTYSFTENNKKYNSFNLVISFITFAESKAVNERYQQSTLVNEEASNNEIERLPYEDEFLGVDSMVECPNCYSIVPSNEFCIECNARLR